jgi:hypothetical protein
VRPQHQAKPVQKAAKHWDLCVRHLQLAVANDAGHDEDANNIVIPSKLRVQLAMHHGKHWFPAIIKDLARVRAKKFSARVPSGCIEPCFEPWQWHQARAAPPLSLESKNEIIRGAMSPVSQQLS